MDEILKRIPPHSIEAEQTVIGSMIFDNSIIDDVLVIVEARDFYQPDLKTIYQGIRKLKQLNKPVDLITLSEALGADLDRVGGQDYIGKLVMAIHTSAHYKNHCEIIKDKSFLRKAIKYASDIQISAYEQDVGDVINKLSLTPEQDGVDIVEHQDTMSILSNTMRDVVRRMKSKDNSLRGLPTGIPSLDHSTGGMKPGELIGLKAGPNVGKSVFAINICQYLANKGIETCYFAYEMVKEQFGYRLAASEIRIPIMALVNPKEELRGNMKYKRKIKEYANENVKNIHIFSADQLRKGTVLEIEQKMKLFPDTKMIVVDYLQLLSHPEISNRFDAFTENERLLKRLATRKKIPVIIILGENKDGTIKGTNDIEHDLDQLYEIKRNKYGETEEERAKTIISNLKGRDGKICHVKSRFFEDYIEFKELDNGR